MATSTTNLGLVKPATTDNVDVSVQNGNADRIDAFAWSAGTWTPELLAGGSGYTYTNMTANYYKVGRLVMLNLLVWGLSISNPTTDGVKFSVPFDGTSVRNYGMFGYNGTNIVNIYSTVSVENNSTFLAMARHDPSTGGEIAVKGTELSGTFQFQIMYMAAS